MDSEISHIVQLILDESDNVKNIDPVSRIYSVYMRVSQAVSEVMGKIREAQRNEQGGDKNHGDT